MKILKALSLLTCLLLLCISLTTQASWLNKPPKKEKNPSGVIYPALPKEGQFVIDNTNSLSTAAKERINLIAGKLWNEEHVPIVVVMIDNLASMRTTATIEHYTRDLFNHWQLGDKERNYGVILLVAKADRKARIAFGSSWGNVYDDKAALIMNDYIVPEFRQGDFNQGVIVGVDALSKTVRGLKLPPITTPPWLWPLIIVSTLLVIGVVVSLFKSGRSGWGWALIAFIGLMLFMILRSANSGGGLSGGGDSSGGGATGSW